MKRIAVYFVLFLLLLIPGSIIIFQAKENSMEKLCMTIKKNPEGQSVNRLQAKKDVRQLQWIFKNKYGGYSVVLDSHNFFKMNKNLEQKISNYFKTERTLSATDFASMIHDSYSPIIDGHLYVSVNIKESLTHYSFYTHTDLYFGDVYFRKSSDNYYVSESSVKGISKGEKYSDSEKFLFPYISKGKNIYRFGRFSADEIQELQINIGENTFSIPAKSNSTVYNQWKNPEALKDGSGIYMNCIETKDSTYISCNSFSTVSPENKFGKFYSYAENIRSGKKKNVILDFRNNSGGLLEIPLTFLAKLFIEDQENQNLFVQTRITNYNENLSPKFESSFAGTLYIIADRTSASSVEWLIALCKTIDDASVYIIGENTSGCIAGGDPYKYALKNSGITVTVPATFNDGYITNHHSSMGEGAGFIPDYWAFNKDILKCLVELTNDSSLEKRLPMLDSQIY